ncbi:MAG TPA: cytochrome c [Candidatus Sulfotelmatobacter sp.]|nr:cytochrome c [Candidatus Sulfotelmatobacter sp.]
MKLVARTVALAVGVVVAAAGMRLLAQEAKEATAKHDFSGAERQLVIKGKQLYSENCLHCHGLNMVTPGTAAFDLRQFPHDDKARFVNSVTHGKNNRMPAWGDILKPEDIDALWAYVLTGGKG